MNGSITYRNIGYDDGLVQNDIIITRHTHTSSCYCMGNFGVIEKINDNGDYYKLRIQCSNCPSIAVLACDSGYYYSKKVGDIVGTHDKTGNISIIQWETGTANYPKCGVSAGTITSILINDVEYLN